MNEQAEGAGTIIGVVRLPDAWPPDRKGPLFIKKTRNHDVSVYALATGQLELVIVEAGQELVNFVSQIVRVENGGWVLLTLAWSEGQGSIRLNKIELVAHDKEPDEVVDISPTDHQPSGVPAFEDPSATAACSEWMNWREHHYSSPKPTAKKGRRLKDFDEQAAELRQAYDALRVLEPHAEEGRGYAEGHLAAELRALLCWNGSNYNPLLLRIAGRLDLPLPLYVMPNPNHRPDALDEADAHFTYGAPSIKQIFPGQEILDIQEWLSRDAVTLRGEELPGNEKKLSMSGKDLIRASASIMGVAHYDEGVPYQLDVVKNILGPRHNQLEQFILAATRVTRALCRFCLRESHSSNSEAR